MNINEIGKQTEISSLIRLNLNYYTNDEIFDVEYEGFYISHNQEWIFLETIDRWRQFEGYVLLKNNGKANYTKISGECSKRLEVTYSIDEILQKIIKEREIVNISWKGHERLMGYLETYGDFLRFSQIDGYGENDGVILRDKAYIWAIQWDTLRERSLKLLRN